jgi:hypothetical protein
MGTEEDTFNRLRRSSYNDACTEYVMACLYLRSDASEEEKIEVSEPALNRLGWTYQDLMGEHMRTRNRPWQKN